MFINSLELKTLYDRYQIDLIDGINSTCLKNFCRRYFYFIPSLINFLLKGIFKIKYLTGGGSLLGGFTHVWNIPRHAPHVFRFNVFVETMLTRASA